MRRTDVRTVLVLAPPNLRWVRDLPHLEEVGARYAARQVESWEELHAELRDAPPSTVSLVDPCAGADGAGPSRRVLELVERHPMNPVVAALPLRPERTEDVRTLLEWGVSELLDLELEPAADAVVLRVRQAHARPLKRRIEAVLQRTLSVDARTLLWAAAEVAVDGGGAQELARMFEVAPRTVSGLCTREGLPAPRHLHAWMRLFLAAALLEGMERTTGSVARACGYATNHALRRAFRETLGRELPARAETFGAVAEGFGTALRAAREAARAQATGVGS